jgi:hypothetical protein
MGYSLNVALAELLELEQKQSGLINGSFTAKAHKYKVKVKELRQAYDNHKQKIQDNSLDAKP